MVINIDSFRRSFKDPNKENKANIIHRYNDKLGYPPIQLIKETNPIVIIDEPQSVDNTEKSKEAIASLNDISLNCKSILILYSFNLFLNILRLYPLMDIVRGALSYFLSLRALTLLLAASFSFQKQTLLHCFSFAIQF